MRVMVRMEAHTEQEEGTNAEDCKDEVVALGSRKRFRGANWIITDGPFAETKELIASCAVGKPP